MEVIDRVIGYQIGQLLYIVTFPEGILVPPGRSGQI